MHFNLNVYLSSSHKILTSKEGTSFIVVINLSKVKLGKTFLYSVSY